MLSYGLAILLKNCPYSPPLTIVINAFSSEVKKKSTRSFWPYRNSTPCLIPYQGYQIESQNLPKNAENSGNFVGKKDNVSDLDENLSNLNPGESYRVTTKMFLAFFGKFWIFNL